MSPFKQITVAILALLLAESASFAEIKATVEHNDNDHAAAGFKFKNVPAPSTSDAATKAKFTIVDGDRDENGGGLDKLNDGKLPTEADEPAENFFFNAIGRANSEPQSTKEL